MPSTISFLLCLTTFVLGQLGDQSRQFVVPNEPHALVASFYTQVVDRHPSGLPMASDMRILAPFLSKALLHRIDLARACEHDYFRQNGYFVKAPIAWMEAGLFSGPDELTSPKAFAIARTESEKDGPVHVYVTLKWWQTSDNGADIHYHTPNRPYIWQVAAIVTREKGRFVVDDVVYIKDKDRVSESRLSELLSEGCEGARWVGYHRAN